MLTYEEKKTLIKAALISLDHGIPLSLDQFKLFVEWLTSIPMNLSSPNEDELAAAQANFKQVLQRRFIA